MRPTAKVKCQSCGGGLGVSVPEKPGIYKYQCPTCQGMVAVKFSQEKIDEIVKKAASKPNLPESPKPSVSDGSVEISPRPVPNKTMTIDDIEWDIHTSRGELVQVTGFFSKNKRFELRNGHNIIGRAGSDLNFPKDPTMSRRSVDIEVVQNEIGYVFRFAVLSAANPVLHNALEMHVGDKIALNYGDSIKLGNTLFRFEKEKK